MSQMEKLYKTVKSALSIENNVVVYGTKIVVPPALRRKVLESAHDPIHTSAEMTKAHIEHEFWWPELLKDVERYIYE